MWRGVLDDREVGGAGGYRWRAVPVSNGGAGSELRCGEWKVEKTRGWAGGGGGACRGRLLRGGVGGVGYRKPGMSGGRGCLGSEMNG